MKHLYYKVVAWASATGMVLLPKFAFATVPASGLAGANTNLETAGGKMAGAQSDLPTLVGNIINGFLGILGVIFVVLIVYSGFLYMTASGDDTKVKKAKSILSQAVIGLVIIVAAYAISNFVIDVLVSSSSAS